ncbi:hypothetical protein F4825DRAFT_237562 [Nemania diffusa]|nr:hypothetical protein F4825DRAFT_237562 [Nemania diffusa]
MLVIEAWKEGVPRFGGLVIEPTYIHVHIVYVYLLRTGLYWSQSHCARQTYILAVASRHNEAVIRRRRQCIPTSSWPFQAFACGLAYVVYVSAVLRVSLN